MSAPKAIIQVVIAGAQILGKAFAAAGKQAYKNAQHRPAGGALGDTTGVSTATSGSLTDRLTREHRMTVDEARLILNVKREDPRDIILRNYEHLFKANSPPPPPENPTAGRAARQQFWSHYLQSKVVRAKERLEAELASAAAEAEASTAKNAGPQAAESSAPPPPS